jgi:tripartite-type tricarboxylate transporter receptor subunit TctC
VSLSATFAVSGVASYSAITFFGLVAPPGTPEALADKINRDVVNVMKQPTVFHKIRALSPAASFGSRADAAKFFADERALWSKVAAEANIRPTR